MLRNAVKSLVDSLLQRRQKERHKREEHRSNKDKRVVHTRLPMCGESSVLHTQGLAEVTKWTWQAFIRDSSFANC